MWLQEIRSEYGYKQEDQEFFVELLSTYPLPIHIVNTLCGRRTRDFTWFWRQAKEVEKKYGLKMRKVYTLFYLDGANLGEYAKDVVIEKGNQTLPPTENVWTKEKQAKKIQALKYTLNVPRADSRRRAAFRLADVIRLTKTQKINPPTTSTVATALSIGKQGAKHWIKKWHGLGWINPRIKGPGRGNETTFTITKAFQEYIKNYGYRTQGKSFQEDYKVWQG